MSRDYFKSDHNDVYCFFITIFRLAVSAFLRVTDGMASRIIVIKRETRC